MLMRLISAISSTEGRAMALMRRYASRFEGSSPRRMVWGTIFCTSKKPRMPVICKYTRLFLCPDRLVIPPAVWRAPPRAPQSGRRPGQNPACRRPCRRTRGRRRRGARPYPPPRPARGRRRRYCSPPCGAASRAMAPPCRMMAVARSRRSGMSAATVSATTRTPDFVRGAFSSSVGTLFSSCSRRRTDTVCSASRKWARRAVTAPGRFSTAVESSAAAAWARP